jgi:hypothetical protein
MSDMPRIDQQELGRFLNWLFLLMFFMFVPPAILYTVAYIVDLLGDPQQQIKLLKEFRRDLPLFVLTF